MNSLLSALFIVFFVQLALGARRTTPRTRASDTVITGQAVSFGDIDQIIIVIGESPCMASCMPAMRNETLRNTTETDISDEAKFKEICDNYFAAADCLLKCPDGDQNLLNVISSSAHYMCVERRATFQLVMPCIRKQKEALKKECTDKCAALFGATQMIQELTNASLIQTQETISSTPFPLVGEVCNVIHCAIPCGRDLLNDRCERDLNAGDLMMEMTIRPLEANAKLVKKMSAKAKTAISRQLPKACKFIIDERQLNQLRESPGDLESKKLRHTTRRPKKLLLKTTTPQQNVE